MDRSQRLTRRTSFIYLYIGVTRKTAVIGIFHLMAFLALQNLTKDVQVEKFFGLHLDAADVNQQENKLVICSPVPYSPILCSPMQCSLFPLAPIVLRCSIRIGNQVAVLSK